MKIDTKFFGKIEINEESIIDFEEGILGFQEYKKFLVIDIEDNQNLKCLQSVDDKNVCLMMMLPWDYFSDYEIELSDRELEKLEISHHEDTMVYNVITVREDKMTANLSAPIIINVRKNKGKQTILQNTKYKIRQEIKCLF